jgi:hypothetical protein
MPTRWRIVAAIVATAACAVGVHLGLAGVGGFVCGAISGAAIMVATASKARPC